MRCVQCMQFMIFEPQTRCFIFNSPQIRHKFAT